MTWLQPEDQVGHELRPARGEGKDVGGGERRGLAAGGAPAPSPGASQEQAPPEAADPRRRDRFQQGHEQPDFLRRPVRRARGENGEPSKDEPPRE